VTPAPRGRGTRIVLLCEGESEEIAAKYFLRRQLEAVGLKAVGLHPINLNAKIEDIFTNTRRFRKDRDVVAVFTLVDLYGFNRVAFQAHATVGQKVEAARAWLREGASDVDPGFFHPHLAVHDLEAWLLAEGAALAERLHHRIAPHPRAEELDFERPPGKLVDDLFQKHRKEAYRKTIDGPPLYKSLAFDLVYQSCLYFREFYDDLQSTAKAARIE
jgi:hypothetical protein